MNKEKIMRDVVMYRATANSSGIDKVILCIDKNDCVRSEQNGEGGSKWEFIPWIHLNEIRNTWCTWNLRETREEALTLYRSIELKRIEDAHKALAAVA